MTRADVISEVRVVLGLTFDMNLPTWFEEPQPTVSVESFFVGNDDWGSIGCNLGTEVGGPGAFYRVLREIRDGPDVHDVRVSIVELVDDDSWPFSDTVYVTATCRADVLASKLSPLQPDSLEPADPSELVPGLVLVDGCTMYRVWWD